MATDTRSTCPYCGVGCGVIIESEGTQITGVRGDPDHTANFGRLCTKGSTLHLTAAASITRQVRALRPMQRTARGGPMQPVGWDRALDTVADRFATVIERHGPDAVGLYLSGQLLTEDYYVFNKLAKGLIGTNNVDTNSRLCMSSAVAGYKQSLGADAPPACYDDIALAGTVFLTGSNMAWAHPVLFRRLEDARRARPGQKLVVVDPRRTETAESADLHLQLLPGTDVVLHHALLHVMLWEGLVDQAFIAAHTTGFAALRDRVREFSPAHAAKTCGLREADIVQAARWFAEGPTLSLYCQGLNQSSSGTDKNSTLINLHLATGQIGRPGAGPFSLTGQPNAMGGREVGGLANLLSAHRDLDNPVHRAEVAALWGVTDVPAAPGKTAVEMFQAAADGEIKALWIVCTNPAQSLPDQALVQRALQRAEFVVLQDAYAHTATAAHADLLLPASSWGEKDGSVTNSERRISRVRRAVPPPGQARDDWQIAVDVAQRLERRLPSRRVAAQAGRTLFPYDSAEAVWAEHRETTRRRDLDITGLSWGALDTPQQWPCAEGATAGTARLYTDHRFAAPDGRARFVAPAWRPVADARDARFPVALTTGRLRDQWHGMSRTGTLGRLFGHVAEPVIQMNPQDMARRLLKEGDLVHVTSKRGSILVPLQASDEIGMSQAFIAMHWGEEFLSGASSTGEPLMGVNALTTSAYCPSSKQPELKHAAVKILRAELPWTLLGVAWLPEADALRAREELKALMGNFPFVSCVPFSNNTPLAQGAAGERAGLLIRAAAHEAPSDKILQHIEALLGLDGHDVLRYADKKKGQRRAVQLVREGEQVLLNGFCLAGDTTSETWIKTLLQDELPAQAYGRLLLVPGAKAPLAVHSRGKAICSCFNVTDVAIGDELAKCSGHEDERLGQLQTSLKCGTNCGSCLPELKRMVRSTMPRAAVSALSA